MMMTDPAVRQAPGSAWARLCRVLFRHPLYRPLRQRRNRRILVIAYLAVLVAIPLAGWATDRLWVVGLLFIPFMAGAVLLGAATQGVLDRPISRLDERELQLRQSVFRDPYPVGVTFGLIAGMITMAAFELGDALMLGLLVTALSGVFLVPTMVLAWRTPDEVDDEA